MEYTRKEAKRLKFLETQGTIRKKGGMEVSEISDSTTNGRKKVSKSKGKRESTSS